MLTVHHLGISQSDRVVWLCEELGLDYELVKYDRDPVTRMAPPQYKALHPAGTAPVIDDGEVRLSESGAIIDYIVHAKAGGRLAVAPDAPNFADYLFWLHYANGSMAPAAMIEMVLRALELADDVRLAALRARLDAAWDQVEARLGEVPYFAGSEFTAADIMMVFPLTTMRIFIPTDISNRPNIRAYLKRIAARPAFKSAMQKADPGFTPPID
jgi:glutathione S-transferase